MVCVEPADGRGIPLEWLLFDFFVLFCDSLGGRLFSNSAVFSRPKLTVAGNYFIGSFVSEACNEVCERTIVKPEINFFSSIRRFTSGSATMILLMEDIGRVLILRFLAEDSVLLIAPFERSVLCFIRSI